MLKTRKLAQKSRFQLGHDRANVLLLRVELVKFLLDRLAQLGKTGAAHGPPYRDRHISPGLDQHAFIQGDIDLPAVSYTQLDVYKRQPNRHASRRRQSHPPTQ